MRSNKKIHIAGAGGAAGIGMTRCLKDDYLVQGHDGSMWAEQLMECLPEQEGENMWYCDMILPIPDKLVHKYAGGGKMEGEVCSLSFLPELAQIELCQDKAKTAKVMGELAPHIYWVRETHGAGGHGAQMASEYLPGRNFSVEFAFWHGQQLGRFQKERLSYLVKEREPNVTVSGSSAVSICTNYHHINAVAVSSLQLLPGELHGFYGVDLRENDDGVPKVTEINAGRLLTASYVYFHLSGYNLALAGVKTFLGEPYTLGVYPEGYGIIRQIDKLPHLYPPEVTQKWMKTDSTLPSGSRMVALPA